MHGRALQPLLLVGDTEGTWGVGVWGVGMWGVGVWGRCGTARLTVPADDRLYSATVADFQASDAVIYRSVRGPALRSIKYSSRWLRGAWGRRGRGALWVWGRSGADGRAVPRAALRPRDAPRSARLLLLPGDGGGAGAAGEGGRP